VITKSATRASRKRPYWRRGGGGGGGGEEGGAEEEEEEEKREEERKKEGEEKDSNLINAVLDLGIHFVNMNIVIVDLVEEGLIIVLRLETDLRQERKEEKTRDETRRW